MAEDADDKVRVLQPAAFLTERSKFSTDTVHPSARKVRTAVEEQQLHRDTTTMQKLPETSNYETSDVPVPTEIVEEDDTLTDDIVA